MEQFKDFLESVDEAHRAFAEEVHGNLTGAKRKPIIEKKAAGYLVVYKHPETKKSVFNFYFRKNGLHARLYPGAFTGNITLTDAMIAELDKAPDCKRLTGAADCSDNCVTGYDFTLRGKHYQKCRLCAFQFLVTEESKPVILKWVQEELTL